ncbi:MAG: hypothetical protein CMB15_02420 [Euryarchaeota archaeon]|nr:hypothetical protein [Euryarchaeota archaeon]|tara:strand:- start:1085 stop:1315 length:231 start_codon:yes stop_codon:yes gene_type:complete
MKSCDYGDCSKNGVNISRLSPEGFLVATGNKAYSFREAYKRFHYCESCHELLMKNVWNRVRKKEDKDDDHVAPTAI